jgi:hypothetical protein
MPNHTAAPVVATGGVNAIILPSPGRKVRKTLHQEQVSMQNRRKQKAFQALENNITWLTSKELEVLLRWKGVPVLKMGNIANRQVLYQCPGTRGYVESVLRRK